MAAPDDKPAATTPPAAATPLPAQAVEAAPNTPKVETRLRRLYRNPKP